tara:strand:+ start:93 stop:566 length:474 start_codon:yes stop_codon:yes gene_type:complete
MSTVILDTITGKSTATTITIGSTPVVSASANSLTIRGEGSAQTSIQQGLAKFWIAMNGSGTPAAVDSFNVSTLTDVGTGNYKFDFSSNFNAAKGYWTTGCMGHEDDHNGSFVKVCMPMNDDDILTSSLEISATYSSSSSTGDYDYVYVNMAGLGDLA